MATADAILCCRSVKRHAEGCYFNKKKEKGTQLRRKSDILFNTLRAKAGVKMSQEMSEKDPDSKDDFIKRYYEFFKKDNSDIRSHMYELNKRIKALRVMKDEVSRMRDKDLSFFDILNIKYQAHLLTAIRNAAGGEENTEEWAGFRKPHKVPLFKNALREAIELKLSLKKDQGTVELKEQLEGL